MNGRETPRKGFRPGGAGGGGGGGGLVPQASHGGPWTPFAPFGNVKFVSIKMWRYPARTQVCQFVCQGTEVKLRLIILRGGEGGSGGKGPGSRSGAPFGGFPCRSSWYNKVQLYCRSAGKERALFLPISDKIY